jgi:hypothetical protein
MQPKGQASCNEWLATVMFKKMNPLLLFDAVLDQALPFISQADAVEALYKDIEIGVILAEEFGVKLPLIGKYLVHSWVDNLFVTERAWMKQEFLLIYGTRELLRFLMCHFW